MILVKVLELIVNVNRGLDVLCNVNQHSALIRRCIEIGTSHIVLVSRLLDLVAHYIQGDAQR